jgi:hypothetical protein
MAKGWESKSVESQIQELESKRRGKEALIVVDVGAHRRREVLLLSRARVQRDLELSQDQRYRDQLMHALADLEAQLSALG